LGHLREFRSESYRRAFRADHRLDRRRRIGRARRKDIRSGPLDTLLEKLGLKPIFERAGLKLRGAYFLGRLVYWFIIIAFLLAASDSLGLYALSGFLTSGAQITCRTWSRQCLFCSRRRARHFLRRVVTAS